MQKELKFLKMGSLACSPMDQQLELSCCTMKKYIRFGASVAKIFLIRDMADVCFNPLACTQILISFFANEIRHF